MAIATMEVDREAVFQAVDEQRRRLGLRRRDVTEVLGVTRSAYSNWTNGQGLDASRLLRVCAWLDVDPRTFAMETPEILPDPAL